MFGGNLYRKAEALINYLDLVGLPASFIFTISNNKTRVEKCKGAVTFHFSLILIYFPR